MSNSEKSIYVSIVCYLRGNGNHIKSFVALAGNKLRSVYSSGEIILVDDASGGLPEGLVKELEDVLPEGIILSIIKTDRFHGRDECLLFGMQYAIGDFVMEFDAPGFTDTGLLMDRLMEASMQGHDGILAVPEKEGTGFGLLRRLCGKEIGPLCDSKAGMFSRRFINKLFDRNRTVELRQFLFQQTGYQIHIVPCLEREETWDKEEKRRTVVLYRRMLLLHSNLFRYVCYFEITLTAILGLCAGITGNGNLRFFALVLAACLTILDLLYISDYRKIQIKEETYRDKFKGWSVRRINSSYTVGGAKPERDTDS